VIRLYLVKLKPISSRKFHFGSFSLELNDNIFHSDSLFSAICNNYVAEYGDKEIENFVANFPKITSVFYGYESANKEILFIPRPIDKKVPNKEYEKDRKVVKKANFIEISLIGKPLEDRTDIKLIGNCLVNEDDIDEDFSLYEDIVEEKIAIDRLTGRVKEGALFYVSGILVKEKAFLYFLIDCNKISEELRRSIELLQIFGIGGEISSGFGQVEVEIKEFRQNINSDGEEYTNLSLIIPKNEEIKYIKSWDIIERKGYVYPTNELKKSIYAIKEGSVFKEQVEGRIVKVSDNAYRYGKAFLIRFAI
jgi:CRISPR-associated protein Csm4